MRLKALCWLALVMNIVYVTVGVANTLTLLLPLLPLWWVAVSPTIQVWLEREFVLAAGLVRQILQSRRGVGSKR